MSWSEVRRASPLPEGKGKLESEAETHTAWVFEDPLLKDLSVSAGVCSLQKMLLTIIKPGVYWELSKGQALICTLSLGKCEAILWGSEHWKEPWEKGDIPFPNTSNKTII